MTLAIATFIKLMTIDQLFRIPNGYIVSVVVCITMFFTIIIAKMIGGILPLFAKALKLDPAVVASPFITTIVDALSLIIYCNVALLLLKPLGVL
jgi:magnesium transporter